MASICQLGTMSQSLHTPSEVPLVKIKYSKPQLRGMFSHLQWGGLGFLSIYFFNIIQLLGVWTT